MDWKGFVYAHRDKLPFADQIADVWKSDLLREIRQGMKLMALFAIAIVAVLALSAILASILVQDGNWGRR